MFALKMIMKFKYFIPVVILIGLTYSCSITKKLEKQLIGKYAVKMLKSSVDEQQGDTYTNLLQGLLEGSYIKFNTDKTYELLLAGKKTSGKWLFSDDGKTILTDNPNIKFSINKFTESGLELYSKNKDDSVLMILQKINE